MGYKIMQMQDQLLNSENVEDGSYDSFIFEFKSFVVNAIFQTTTIVQQQPLMEEEFVIDFEPYFKKNFNICDYEPKVTRCKDGTLEVFTIQFCVYLYDYKLV
jgi:hypothetical protein